MNVKWERVCDEVLSMPMQEFLEVVDDGISNGFTFMIADGVLYQTEDCVDLNGTTYNEVVEEP